MSEWERHKRAMQERGLPPLGRRCERCMGNGYTKATIDISPSVMRTLAKYHPNEPVENSIKKEKCHYCDGTGMHGEDGPNVHDQYSLSAPRPRSI
jgi:DnaJ-class molecular chaperone